MLHRSFTCAPSIQRSGQAPAALHLGQGGVQQAVIRYPVCPNTGSGCELGGSNHSRSLGERCVITSRLAGMPRMVRGRQRWKVRTDGRESNHAVGLGIACTCPSVAPAALAHGSDAGCDVQVCSGCLCMLSMQPSIAAKGPGRCCTGQVNKRAQRWPVVGLIVPVALCSH